MYHPAQPDQTRQYCSTPSEAKFWREAQLRPTDWQIVPNGRGYLVIRVRGALRSQEGESSAGLSQSDPQCPSLFEALKESFAP